MNRFIYPAFALFGIAAGCAGPIGPMQRSQSLAGAQQTEQVEPAAPVAILASAQFSPPASALVFDLPIARDLPPLDLDRASRQPGAFVGFEGPSVEYHTVLINNTQSAGGGYGDGCGWGCDLGDSYQRQDLIQRTSVRYR